MTCTEGCFANLSDFEEHLQQGEYFDFYSRTLVKVDTSEAYAAGVQAAERAYAFAAAYGDPDILSEVEAAGPALWITTHPSECMAWEYTCGYEAGLEQSRYEAEREEMGY